MIVRPDGSDLLLIRQPDHAALAGRIMTAWRADGLPTRPTRDRVLAATRLHDLAWEAEDAAPRIDPASGAPYDYITAPLAVRQGVWPRTIERLAPEDPYVAALVAQHALTVYRRFARAPEWQAFFRTLEQRRDDLFVESQMASASAPAPARGDAATDAAAASGAATRGAGGLDTFLQDYVIVGLGDLFSQIYCKGWREPYLMESYQAILHPDRLEIAPDPFDGASVPLDVEARRIPARTYASDADLQATLAEAPLVRLTGVCVGAPLPSIP